MQFSKYKKNLKILLLSAITISLCSCDFPNRIQKADKNALCFDTIISIAIYDSDRQKAENLANESIEMCYEYEELFSSTISTSDISKINDAGGKSVNVNEKTAELINKSLHYSEISDGLFDISVESVTKLWDFHEGANNIPNEDIISQAQKHVNYKNIHVADNKTVTLSDADAQIEAGGLAKGYIADKIAEYLLKQNVHGALINMGGDLRVIGCPSDKNSFSIGINDPSSSGTPLFPIYITDASVATSGTYERSFTVGDKLYHHILDPKTGYPCNTDLVQATVITDSSIKADALATICILKGCEDAQSLIESLDNTEAVLITKSGDTRYSSGMNKYLTNAQ